MDHTTPAFIAIATNQHLSVLGIDPTTAKALAQAAGRDMQQRGGLEAWHQGTEAYAAWYRKVSHKTGSHMRKASGGGLDWWVDGLARLRDLEQATPAPYLGDDYPLTLTQARAFPGFPHFDDLAISDLALGMLAARWLQLLGFDKGPVSAELMAAADEDFFGDVPLIAALAGSAEAFREWWARDDASIYCLTNETGSEDWAADVLGRVPNVWPHALPD